MFVKDNNSHTDAMQLSFTNCLHGGRVANFSFRHTDTAYYLLFIKLLHILYFY